MEYLVALLRPVADLFNELHSDSVLKESPLEYVELCLSECKRPEEMPCTAMLIPP